MVTDGKGSPPYVATLPVFETPAARYPAWNEDSFVANSSGLRFASGLPSDLPSWSTIANLTVGLAIAAATIASLIA